jgi:nicotinamide-nucleotide amidase
MNENPVQLVQHLAAQLSQNQQKICTAESCTGGLIAKTCTDLAGSSDWFERGFITYSNEAKHELLAVPMVIIDEYGAVSEPVAMAMAKGAVANSHADYAVAVTGVAGPGGGSEAKPVGTVWVSVASKLQSEASCYQFDGDREAVRQATLVQALQNLISLLDN